MASKINPKGIFKSNSRSKGPNPKGINPGGINNKPASKPVTNTTTPRTRAGVTKGTTPGTGNKYSSKTPINTNTSVSQGRGGVSKGGSQGTANKYANKSNTTAALKARADARIAAEKVTSEKSATSESKPRTRAGVSRGVTKDPLKQPKEVLKNTLGKNTGRAGVTKGNQAAIKAAKAAKLAKLGKKAAIVAGVGALAFGAGAGIGMIKNASNKKDSTNTGKPQVGGNKVNIPKKETTPKPDNKDKKELKYVVGEPKKDLLPKIKSDKPNWKSGSIAKNLNTAVTAIDKSKKTKPSDNFGSVKKTDTKKADTKTEEKKSTSTSTSASTAKPTVKKAEPVGTLAPKSTTEIASKTLEEAKTVTPAKTITPTTSTITSPTTSSTPVVKAQPRATFINKVRGSVNESRERRAGRAASRGNESRAEKLEEKISATEKKMMMKKGGVVKSKTKKK